MQPSSWESPAAPPALLPDEVHVWRVPLDDLLPGVPGLLPLLSDDERVRARRFVFDVHRHRFVAGRGVLRLLLGGYLALPPEQLAFDYGAQGKPTLLTATGTPPLRFNVSHSHAMALLAFSRGRTVGVDIEQVSADRATVAIAQRFFAPEEVAVFEALPEHQWVEAFFNAWTRKEAYMKADGRGLALGLDNFCVTLAPGEPAALLSTRWNPHDARRWSMQALQPAHDYTGALAVEGEGWRLRCLELDPGLIVNSSNG